MNRAVNISIAIILVVLSSPIYFINSICIYILQQVVRALKALGVVSNNKNTIAKPDSEAKNKS